MIKYLLCLLLWSLATYVQADHPCALRDYGHNRRVCVCNSTYCDTIERVRNIENGQYVVFISSKDGLRFSKTIGNFVGSESFNKSRDASFTFTVDPSVHYQKIVGFGGAFTDAAGINILSLSEKAQKHLLRSYFSRKGIEYNMCRVPIGGTDFSTRTYSYDDGPPDLLLENFSLAEEDFKYKIPLIIQAKKISSKKIRFVTSSWSPPPWMKSSSAYSGFGLLKKEYFDSFAKYLIRFLDEYKKHNINFWAISTGNEPIDGLVPIEDFNSLGWFPWSMADWIANHFGPQLRNSSHKDILLMAVEDQRVFLPWIVDLMVWSNSKILDYIDGFSIHWYLDFLIGDWAVEGLHKQYPEKFMLYTEACQGDKPWQKAVVIGSWERGESYLASIIDNVNIWVTGWIDWNMALDMTGGPNWAKNYVDSPILVNASANEFYKQPMFYAMGHVSKFIEHNAVRIGLSPTVSHGVHAMAVQNPDGRIVVVLLNTNGETKEVTISIQGRGLMTLELPPSSFATVLC